MKHINTLVYINNVIVPLLFYISFPVSLLLIYAFSVVSVVTILQIAALGLISTITFGYINDKLTAYLFSGHNYTSYGYGYIPENNMYGVFLHRVWVDWDRPFGVLYKVKLTVKNEPLFECPEIKAFFKTEEEAKKFLDSRVSEISKQKNNFDDVKMIKTVSL